MEMGDGLPGGFIAIDNQSIAVETELPGELRRDPMEMPEEQLIIFCHGSVRSQHFLRNDDHVSRRLRGNVVKSQRLLVFVDDLRGYLSFDDIQEDISLHHRHAVALFGQCL